MTFPSFSPRNAVVILTLLLAFGAAPAVAQTGKVQGNVKSADGQPLAGITVTLLHAGKTDIRKMETDEKGSFVFDDLKRGVYIATVAAEGTKRVTCPGVRIVRGLTRELHLTLMPADAVEPSTCEAPES